MWFRWWHGSVTDPKFAWIARKSGHPVAIVIAVWAALLEHASQESDTGRRGDVSRFDCEAIGVHLGVEEGVAESIVEAMNAKGLISGGRIAQWEKRQPKREDSSRDRMREYRARQNNRAAGDALSSDVTQGDASENVVTQCDAREDKNRADQSKDKENIFPHSGDTRPSRAQSRITPFLSPDERAQIQEWWDKFWAHYPRRVEKKKARETFDHIITRVSPEVRRLRMENISRRLNAYVGEIAKNGTQEAYIKYPARWLSAHDWDEAQDFQPEKPPEPRMFEGITPWTGEQAVGEA